MVDSLLVGWIANIFCALAAGSIVSLAAVFWMFFGCHATRCVTSKKRLRERLQVLRSIEILRQLLSNEVLLALPRLPLKGVNSRSRRRGIRNRKEVDRLYYSQFKSIHPIWGKGRFWNPGNFCLWNLEYRSRNPGLESRIQVPLTKTGIQYNPVPGIRNPRRGVQNPG